MLKKFQSYNGSIYIFLVLKKMSIFFIIMGFSSLEIFIYEKHHQTYSSHNVLLYHFNCAFDTNVRHCG